MKILIAIGRTGGHIFPGLSLAEQLMERLDKVEFIFVGAGEKLERKIFQDHGYRVLSIPIDPMPYAISAKIGRFLFRLIVSLSRAWSILKKTKPDIVIGFGGAISGPILLVAAMIGIPTLIHEQNVVPGRSNRILSRFVTKVAISFAESMKFFGRKDLVMTGNPIRAKILSPDRANSLKSFGFSDNKFTILIIGGSQGSHRINEVVLDAFSRMDQNTYSDLQVIHLTGEEDYWMVKKTYERLGFAKAIFPFLNQMGEAYAASDLVIARAGAATITEISSAGLPAILIPYSHAAGHQRANAGLLNDAGAAILIEEDSLTPELLKDCIMDLMVNLEKLTQMAVNSKAFGNPDAGQRLADEVLKLLRC